MELSWATSNLQQLGLSEEHDIVPTEGCPAVIIPEHLQVTNADYSCLSLGTFRSGITGTDVFSSTPLNTNLEVASDTDTNMPLIGQPDTRYCLHYFLPLNVIILCVCVCITLYMLVFRISEYHQDGQIGPFLDDSVAFITGISTDNYGMLSTSQPEVIRNDSFAGLHTIQTNFPSASGYAFSNTTQPTAAAYTYRQAYSHMQNLSAFSSAMVMQYPLFAF